jgi:hypothetical protein
MAAVKFHITQDEHGFWMLSLEDDSGLRVIACHFVKPGHLIHDALDYVSKGIYPGATTLIDAPDPKRQLPKDPKRWPTEYGWPEPKRART